jgi:uncharacterized protein YrrD
MFRRTDELIGYKVRGREGDIGTVHDIYFDDATWGVRYLIVDTGPWLFGRRVLVAPEAFGQPSTTDQSLPTTLTKEQVESSPDIDLEKPVSRQEEEKLHDYFGWSHYWIAVPGPVGAGTATGTAAPLPPPVPTAPSQADVAREEVRPEGDPHLRSVKEVTGYHIQATDGEIGHVEEFLIEDVAWRVGYLVIDTRNWLPGRNVLIYPDWIDRISWNTGEVHVTVTRQQVKDSPEFDPKKAPTREYETLLFRHYGVPYYWL